MIFNVGEANISVGGKFIDTKLKWTDKLPYVNQKYEQVWEFTDGHYFANKWGFRHCLLGLL